ncbi:hypothetical protein ARMSODRAFT_732732 [Armillaria solidipes]|uniref:Uncharacterized protein n=1 Tax=Armillaria solidipes TaxID=1076256 RepID=A0A2H3AN25_9AGAR|nr:hypothetical protein ARMSODRAFT_732732 [Armillaria solidipes]
MDIIRNRYIRVQRVRESPSLPSGTTPASEGMLRAHTASLASRLLLLTLPKSPSSLQAQQRANPHPTSEIHIRRPSRHRPYPASCDSLPPLSHNRPGAPPFPTSRVSLHPASSLLSNNSAPFLSLT